jgi:hypothetical protein
LFFLFLVVSLELESISDEHHHHSLPSPRSLFLCFILSSKPRGHQMSVIFWIEFFLFLVVSRAVFWKRTLPSLRKKGSSRSLVVICLCIVCCTSAVSHASGGLLSGKRQTDYHVLKELTSSSLSVVVIIQSGYLWAFFLSVFHDSCLLERQMLTRKHLVEQVWNNCLLLFCGLIFITQLFWSVSQ